MRSRQIIGWLAVLLVGSGLMMPPFWVGVLRALAVAAAFVALTVVRELGRLAVGTAVGLKPAVVEIGEGKTLFRFRVRGVVWDFRVSPFGSATIFAPPSTDAWWRARVAVLLLVRPAISLAVLLGIRALGAPLLGGGEGIKGALLGAVATAAEVLLASGLVPFSVSGVSIVPFESDGLKLAKLPFAAAAERANAFARYYAASAYQALNDGDPVRAVGFCREGLERVGPPWTDALRNLETVALSHAGDFKNALAQAERDLGRELSPIARAFALNNWSWFAFLERDEAHLRLADRRSADAMVLHPNQSPIQGTRGTVLLWRGRVAEALPLLERSRAGAADRRGRDVNACLVAMALAARGESARAQEVLEQVGAPAATDGLWAEAERRVKASSEPAQALHAVRGHRVLVVKGDGVELHDGGRVQRLATSELEGAEVGLTARGRALLILRYAGRRWRLPLDRRELSWARMLIGGSVLVAPAAGSGQAPAGAERPLVAAQERAYAEHLAAQRLAVSSPKGVLFLGSAVAFAASMLVSTNWQWLAVIMPVLFIHELGHWIAMRAFGHRDARISFIPFLGAATFSKDPFEKRWQEVVMLLAGPVPGILLGIALLLLPIPGLENAHLRSAAIAAILVNGANLLPFHPLDGGRIVHALVTAGRPRLDLAFKSIAMLAFVAGGFASKDMVLGILGLFGLLTWRRTYRLARLEERIRQMPGFEPGLPAAARRDFIFRALAEEPSDRAREWGATVAALDMPLAYRRSPLWRVVAAGVVVLLFIGGGTMMGKFAGRTRSKRSCPTEDVAVALSCQGPDFPSLAAVSWKPRRVNVSVVPSDDRYNPSLFPLGAFVWCHADGAATAKLHQALRDAAAGPPYCTALPWEDLPPDELPATTKAHLKARRTLTMFGYAQHLKGPRGLKSFDDHVQRLGPSADLDPDVVRLLRAQVEDKSPDSVREAREELATRLGPSPTNSCDRILVSNVDASDPEEASDAPAASPPPTPWLRFSLAFTSPADLAPVAKFLCAADCRVTLLPFESDDPRLRFCF